MSPTYADGASQTDSSCLGVGDAGGDDSGPGGRQLRVSRLHATFVEVRTQDSLSVRINTHAYHTAVSATGIILLE